MLSKADKVRKNTLIFISDNKPTIFSICQFSDFCLSVILFKFWPFFFLFGKAYKSFSLFPRIAVMYAPQSGFCYGTSNPRGPLAVKIRHLKILGYNSVLVRLWHLQKIMSHSHFCTISAYFTSKPFLQLMTNACVYISKSNGYVRFGLKSRTLLMYGCTALPVY